MTRSLLPAAFRTAPAVTALWRNGLLQMRLFFRSSGTWLFFVLLQTTSVHAVDFADDIRQAGEIIGQSGSLTGSNVGASRQPSEPQHGRWGDPGGHSVWVTWQAPTNGLASFSASGSSFPAVIAAYAYESAEHGGSNEPPDPTQPFDGLEAISRSYGGPTNALVSSIRFPVMSGVKYRIAIDGSNGSTGSIVLDWSFAPSGTVLPMISGLPADRALREGDTLTLSFQVESAEKPEYRWFRDGDPIDDAEGPMLTLSNLRRDQLGNYQLRVTLDDFVFFTDAVEIQINTEGQSDSLARDTADDARRSGIERESAGLPSRQSVRALAAPIGVVRGYNGSQIFTTVTARRDPGEPQPCGVVGGASYWWGYQPPENGRVHLDTSGSSFATVLAVYTYDPPFAGYSSLVPVNCDVNSGPNGTSAVDFTGLATRKYLIVVDGVNGARGLVQLNYHLDTTLPTVTPPRIDVQPLSQTAQEGSTVILRVTATGDPVLTYQWFLNAATLTGETNETLMLPNVTLLSSGAYTVRVSNSAGTALSDPAQLVVSKPSTPPSIQFAPQPSTVGAGQNVTLSASALGDPPFHWQWWKNGTAIPGANQPEFQIHSASVLDVGLYSVSVSNSAGSTQTAPVEVRVLVSPPLSATVTGQAISVALPTVGSLRYLLEAAEPGDALHWRVVDTIQGNGGTIVFAPIAQNKGASLFRVRVE